MIVLPRHNWLRLLFVWHGSVLPRIMSRLYMVFGLSLLSALANHWWISLHAESSLNIYIFTLMGVSLAIFLGFRNSASYDRFWEARKLWGLLLIVARTLSGKLLASAPDHPLTQQMLNGICAFNYALKGQLRHDDVSAHLQRLLPPALLARLPGSRSPSTVILGWLHQLNHAMYRDGSLCAEQWQSIDKNLDSLAEAGGGCERIRNTPIPFTYRVLLNRTVTIYCILLPLGLVTSIGWLTPIIAVFIAYTYMALDVLGDELEEPFGKEGNDLPLIALSYSIEASVRELAGQPMTVAEPVQNGIYLH